MRKHVNAVISAVFILFICAVLITTAVKYGNMYAYGFLVSYTDQLDRNSDIFDNISARIYKLDYNARNRLAGRDFLRKANVNFQTDVLGRRIISVGTSDMVKLSTGGYYNLFSDEWDDTKMRELISFANSTGLPTGFVYCHCGLYEDGLLDSDFLPLDSNIECADALVKLFSDNGIAVTDSRESYKNAGLSIDKAINKSDVHWTHRMALATAYDTVKTLNKAFSLGLDETALDISRFNDEVYPELLIGEYGRRIGMSSVPRDDIHVLTPAYETSMIYEEMSDDFETELHREGSFHDAMLTLSNLDCEEGTDYSESAYYIYGHYLARTSTVNESAADKKILIFKDSYGTPVASFLGLAARNVIAVDLRSSVRSMQEWVEAVQPDVVLFAYSQQMLRNYEYVIAG